MPSCGSWPCGWATKIARERPALESFLADYREKTSFNRKILDHLLHDAFSDDEQTEAEADLVLDPDPQPELIEAVLSKYHFRDVKQAYKNLMALSEEKIRFLSTRRCRHFLAAIASQLLKEVGATADPDAALVNLDQVSDSLGGKGVLWELFSFNPPSLRLYVELCAYSPHLSGILTSNPGMLDGLMDSLVLDRLPSREGLQETLKELCWAAEDIEPILHSFKNDQQLRVGVRDLLGKEDIQATTGVLSDIAEVCLAQIAAAEYQKLIAKFGRPQIGDGPRAGEPCDMAILALGKFGGREMNYHSDLDIVFLYEADGQTAFDFGQWSARSTSNQHFFSELGQRIIKTASRLSAQGRLYEVDARLRPTGKSGSLAMTMGEFSRYYAEGSGQLWERQALCKARPVYGSPRTRRAAAAAVQRAAFGHRWRRKDADEIREMRHRLEATVGAGDLKRGPGGIVDIEFLVQMLQLQHARKNPSLRTANTLAALRALARGRPDERRRAGVLRFQLPLVADDRKPPAADELDGPGPASARSDGAEQAGPPAALFQRRRPDERLRKDDAADPRAFRRGVGRGGEVSRQLTAAGRGRSSRRTAACRSVAAERADSRAGYRPTPARELRPDTGRPRDSDAIRPRPTHNSTAILPSAARPRPRAFPRPDHSSSYSTRCQTAVREAGTLPRESEAPLPGRPQSGQRGRESSWLSCCVDSLKYLHRGWPACAGRGRCWSATDGTATAWAMPPGDRGPRNLAVAVVGLVTAGDGRRGIRAAPAVRR